MNSRAFALEGAVRLLDEAFRSEQVRVVLDVWRRSGVRPDPSSAVGLRHAVQVEVRDWALHVRGLSFEAAEYLASKVAVGVRREGFGARQLALAGSWTFTEGGDDETGEWERLDLEELLPRRGS